MDKYCKQLGEIFKEAREKLGASQMSLSYDCLMTQAELSTIEKGKRYLKIGRYQILCEETGIPIELVMDFKNKSELLRMATNPTKADWKKIYKNYISTPPNGE